MPRSVRCPYCLAAMQVEAGALATAQLTCESCKRSFPLGKALPHRKSEAANVAQVRNRLPTWAWALPLIVAGLGGAGWYVYSNLLHRPEEKDAATQRPPDPSSGEGQTGNAVTVVAYGGTLARSKHGFEFAPAYQPVPASNADVSCDVGDGKSELQWELERPEGENSTVIPVSLVAAPAEGQTWGERWTRLPETFASFHLTTCRLGIDEGVRAIHLRYGDTRIFTLPHPAEPLYFPDASAQHASKGRLAFRWRSQPKTSSAALTWDAPDGHSTLALSTLRNPSELFEAELPAQTEGGQWTLHASDGFSVGTRKLSVAMAAAADQADAGAHESTGKVVGTWTAAIPEGAGPPICAEPLTPRLTGKTPCTTIGTGGRYDLSLPVGTYRLCLPETCDLCTFTVGAGDAVTRNIAAAESSKTEVAFQPSEPCTEPDTRALEDRAFMTARFVRSPTAAGKKTGRVEFFSKQPAEVQRGHQVVHGPLELPPGTYRFLIESRPLELAEPVWVSVHAGEQVQVYCDLLREKMPKQRTSATSN